VGVLRLCVATVGRHRYGRRLQGAGGACGDAPRSAVDGALTWLRCMPSIKVLAARRRRCGGGSGARARAALVFRASSTVYFIGNRAESFCSSNLPKCSKLFDSLLNFSTIELGLLPNCQRNKNDIFMYFV